MGRARRSLILVWICALLLSPGLRAFAAKPDPDTEIARRHFARAAELYEAGNYEAAVQEFEATRRTKPSPAIDFNIARCYDRLEKVDDRDARPDVFMWRQPKDNLPRVEPFLLQNTTGGFVPQASASTVFRGAVVVPAIGAPVALDLDRDCLPELVFADTIATSLFALHR